MSSNLSQNIVLPRMEGLYKMEERLWYIDESREAVEYVNGWIMGEYDGVDQLTRTHTRLATSLNRYHHNAMSILPAHVSLRRI